MASVVAAAAAAAAAAAKAGATAAATSPAKGAPSPRAGAASAGKALEAVSVGDYVSVKHPSSDAFVTAKVEGASGTAITVSLLGYNQTITVQKGEIRRADVPEAKKLSVGYSVYLFYWYKSTNTDAAGALQALLRSHLLG